MIDFPHKCESCNIDTRKHFGCGCTSGIPWTDSAHGEGFIGQGVDLPDWGSDVAPYSKTCNQYYRRSPFVISILNDVEDYRSGRLGNSFDLPAHLLSYLRIAVSELAAWECNQQDNIAENASK